MVGSTDRDGRQHCRRWSTALLTMVGTKKYSVFYVCLFEIHSNTVKIPFKWYLNITKVFKYNKAHIAPSQCEGCENDSSII